MRRELTLAVLAFMLLVPVVVTSACGGGTRDESVTTTDKTSGAARDVLADASTLVAQVSDAPEGYRVDTEMTGAMNLSDVRQELGVDELEDDELDMQLTVGFVDGFSISLESNEGLPGINCHAVVYRTSDVAEALFDVALESGVYERRRVSGGDGIGDESAAFRAEIFGLPVYDVLWRYRNVHASCASLGEGATVEQAAQIAEAQQQRMQSVFESGSVSLGDAVYNPTWSPDGGSIAFQRCTWQSSDDIEGCEIFVMNSEGGDLRNLTQSPADDHSPSWSPDGRAIAFVSDRDGRFDDIYVMRRDGTNVLNLTKTPEIDEGSPAWSPIGDRIAFRKDLDWNEAQIIVLNVDGGGKLVLARIEEIHEPSFAWSPDGHVIAFEDSSGGLSTGDSRTGTSAKLTRGLDLWPTWSPDGRRLAFVRGPSIQNKIFVISANGGRVRSLDAPNGFGEAKDPVWSPTDPTIAFRNWNDGTAAISIVNADGGGSRDLTPSRADDHSPAWSPDGHEIAFVRRNPKTGASNIFVIAADGTNERKLTHHTDS